MKADAARNGRPPQDSTEARAFWRAAGLILLFNGLLVAWVLLDPYGDRVSPPSCSTWRGLSVRCWGCRCASVDSLNGCGGGGPPEWIANRL